MKQKDIIFLLIPITLIVIAWIVFNIYHGSVTSTISETLNINILPITADFDTQAISNLKERERVEPLFEFKREESPTPTISPIQAPIITPSPSLDGQTATTEANTTP